MIRFWNVFVKLTGWPAQFFCFRTKVCYEDRKIQSRHIKGPAIIISNHTSVFDYAVYLFVFFTRTLRFQMAEVLFRKRFLGWLLRRLGGIYVDRTQHNFDFVRDALQILDKGGKVGVFPQGRLPVNGRNFPYMPGITVLALQTDAPIIPVYTDGNYGFFKTAHIMVGEEIHIRDLTDQEKPDSFEIKRLTRVLEEKNLALKEELEKRLAKKK